MKSEILRGPAALLAALLLAAVVQLAWAYPRLPQIVATHFDGAGRPDGWMRREIFVAFQAGLIMIMLLSFVGLPRWLARLPTRWYSLPHRDYWLAPERRAQTLADIQRQMMWFVCAIVCTILAVTQLVIEVNLTPDPVLPGTTLWMVFVAFLLFTAVWTVRFVRRFRRSG
jgi:serine/threonine-protein kinase